MSVATASDLGKDIAGKPLFRGISFKLERRDRMTLSGRNGSGKTTLLRALAGQAGTDFGKLSLAKDIKVSLHDQRPPRERDITLRDYVLSGAGEVVEIESELARLEQTMAEGDVSDQVMDAYGVTQQRFELRGGYRWRDNALVTIRGLGFSEEELDRELSTFSGGELTRGSLARALTGEPDLLLLDEPTNHLDIASLEWLESHLQTLDAAIVLVAHDRWFLEAVGTSVLELEAGRAKFFKGTWSAWRKEQAMREMALGKAVEKQQAEIDRMERFIARFGAKATKARAANSRKKKLEKMERIETAPEDKRVMAFQFKEPERPGRTIFELKDARIEVPGKVLMDDAAMFVERGEHVSLVGGNGTGKSTLIQTLTGRRELPTGKVSIGHNVHLGYVSQHAEGLSEGGTLLDATQRATQLTPGKARALLGMFLFTGDDAMKPVDGLSGGERQRFSLAVLVNSGANMLVLDEPTNHLDVESREALEDALRGFPGSLLLVSHDRALLDAVGTRTVAIEHGALNTYEGGWAEYLERRQAMEEAAPSAKVAKKAVASAAKKASNGNGGGAKAAPAKAPSKNAIRDQAKLETQIEKAEAALATLEDELADPSAWNDPRTSAKSQQRHADAKAKVEELYSQLEAVAS